MKENPFAISLPEVKLGDEIDLNNFYTTVDRMCIKWYRLSGEEREIVRNLCDIGHTDFSAELRGLAAAFAVISTNPRKWSSPLYKYFGYSRSRAYRWAIILLEVYINNANRLWEKNRRQDEVSDLLTKATLVHPTLKIIEDWLDEAVDSYYLGHEAIDAVINSSTGAISRAEWRNKIERVEGEIITMW